MPGEKPFFPGDEPPQDPAEREQWRQAMPSEEEILSELDERLEKPLTSAEEIAGREDREKIAGYRSAHEKEEQERAEAELLEGQIERAFTEVHDLYENLSRYLRDKAETGQEYEAGRLQQLLDLEWNASQNEIKAASPRAGMWGAMYKPPESKRRELLGALKHSLSVMEGLKKQIAPSESGQE